MRYVSELKTNEGVPHITELRAPKSQRVESQPITFTKEDAAHVQFPHNDPLVVTIQVANRRVHRALIDNRSSINVLYKATLEKIGLGIRDLRACAMTLYGLNGEGIASTGAVDLVVTFAEYLISVTKIVEFVVVDIPSTNNVLLGSQF